MAEEAGVALDREVEDAVVGWGATDPVQGQVENAFAPAVVPELRIRWAHHATALNARTVAQL